MNKFNADDWYFCASHRGYWLFSNRFTDFYCLTQWIPEECQDDGSIIGGHEVLAEYVAGEHSLAVKDFDEITREPWLK